ncbi:MAG: PCRF domain-containing protein, partial [Dehalococcoidia bacterium]
MAWGFHFDEYQLMYDKLNNVVHRYNEIEELLGMPDVTSDVTQLSKLAKERAELQPVVNAYQQYLSAHRELEDAKALANDADAEMASMAKEELPSLSERLETLESALRLTLLPRDPRDDKNVIV